MVDLGQWCDDKAQVRVTTTVNARIPKKIHLFQWHLKWGDIALITGPRDAIASPTASGR
jgi:hypothetical protein